MYASNSLRVSLDIPPIRLGVYAHLLSILEDQILKSRLLSDLVRPEAEGAPADVVDDGGIKAGEDGRLVRGRRVQGGVNNVIGAAFRGKVVAGSRRVRARRDTHSIR